MERRRAVRAAEQHHPDRLRRRRRRYRTQASEPGLRWFGKQTRGQRGRGGDNRAEPKGSACCQNELILESSDLVLSAARSLVICQSQQDVHFCSFA